MSFSDAVSQELSKQQNVDVSHIGVFVGVDGSQAIVDVDGVRVTMPSLGTYWPVTGERVRLLRSGGLTFLGWPVVPRPTVGKVVAGGSPRCTIEFPPDSGVTQLMGYPENQTATIGKIALIDWTSGGTVMTFVTATPDLVAPDDPTPEEPAKKTQTQTFKAIDSGTYDPRYGSWFTRQVWASSNTSGMWWYGTKIKDSIPDDAVIERVQIFLPAASLSGSDPVLQAHTGTRRPGGSFISTGTVLGKRSGWVTIPNGYGDYLKANNGGMGMNHGGFNKYKGTDADSFSGALKITYTA